MRDPLSAKGLCERCGAAGSHRDANRCIELLRERIALLELLIMGDPEKYRRAKRRCSEGRGIRVQPAEAGV